MAHAVLHQCQLPNSVLGASGATAPALLEQQDAALPGPPVSPLQSGSREAAVANANLLLPPQQVSLAPRLSHATSTLLGKFFLFGTLFTSDRKMLQSTTMTDLEQMKVCSDQWAGTVANLSCTCC